MDNKITKRRLSHLFSYDWLAMIVWFVAIVFAWQLVFQVTSVKITRGQSFKYFIDYTISYKNPETFVQMLADDNVFDPINILSVEQEDLYSGQNDVLFARLDVSDGDVIFTDTVKDQDGIGRAQRIIDSGYVYTLDYLLRDAVNYLNSFKTDGQFDDDKIQAHFLDRMKNDNRFRTDQEKADGLVLEKQRLVKLDKEVLDFEYLLNCGEDVFYEYTRFSQTLEQSSEENKQDFINSVEREKKEGRENARYGIDLYALVGGVDKLSTSTFFSVGQEQTAENVVLLAFNFLSKQPDEQFEVITFINSIVRNCSNLYQGR